MPSRRLAANAETLLWQSRVRLTVVVVLALAWIGVRWRGAESPLGAVASRYLEPTTILRSALALVLGYLAVTAVVYLVAHRRRRASTALVVATLALDATLVFGCALLATPLPYFDRALIVSYFILHFAQLYRGMVAAAMTAVAITGLYVLMLTLAAQAGLPLVWREELWTLALFQAGVIGLIVMQGSASRRLEVLARLFERMEEGDFSREYDERRELRPDHVTQLGRAYNSMRAQLAAIVITDALSGCLNRRGFEQVYARELAQAARDGAALTLLAIDLDHFKQVNDTFGHLAGDAVIREIGALLRGAARPGDVVARVGGEEFALLAPNTGHPGGLQLAERLCAAVRAHRFTEGGRRMPVTASIGVVIEPVVLGTAIAEDLRARADEALYAAKRGGRDRVVLWTQGMRPGTGLSTGEFLAGAAGA